MTVESNRIRATHIVTGRPGLTGSVRAADRSLKLNGGGPGLIDATHFDTVRFPPPEWVHPAFERALADGAHAYTPYQGDEEVLQAVAGTLSGFLDSPVTPAEVAFTPGTQGALFATLSALVDAGDLVMLADPEYLFVERMLLFLGARIARIPVVSDSDEPHLDTAAIEALLPEGPKLLLFSNPHNPTGAVLGEAALAELAELSVRGGFRILADELYSRLVYDGGFTHLRSLPGMAERAITTVGPSKTESLSGFRVGVVVAPPEVVDAISQALAITALRAPAYAQQLLRHWLVDDVEFVAERVEELRGLRRTTLDALNAVPGVHAREQRGTAYAWVDTRGLGVDDVTVARELREGAGLIVSPGYQFGPSATGFFRVCFARDEQQWEQTVKLMAEVLSALGAGA